MSQHLRNLQLFRNDVFVFTETINTVELLKGHVETTIASTLKDGEPIVIRYKETANGDVKALFGTGYVQGTTTTILWSGEEVDVNVESGSEDTDLVQITISEDPKGNFQVSADATVATYGQDEEGLADVTYVEAALADLYHYEYQVKKTVNTETNTKEYTLQVKKSADGEWEDIDEMWSVDAELVVKSGDVVYRHLIADSEGREPGSEGYVETWSAPSTTKGENDKTFLRLVIQGQEDQPVYIPADALVDEYKAGDGIDIENHEVSVKLGETDDTHNVSFEFDEDGNIVANVDLSDVHNYSEGENITISDDYVISAVDTVTTVEAGTGINVDTDEEDEHKYTVSIKKNAAEDNTIVIDEDGVYVAPYTAGDGIDITDNEISVKVADIEGNIISINDNGELIATLADAVKISDLKVVKNDNETAEYYTVGSDNKIAKTTVESEAKITVPAGEKYLLIATSDKNLYGGVLPETDDTFVASGEIVEVPATETTEAKTVIRLTRNDNVNVDVDMTDYVVVDTEAEYVNTAEKPDTMVVNTDGKFTQDVMNVIENYIDNYDCGSFTL